MPSLHAFAAAALLGGILMPSHATVVADGRWSSFTVDRFASQSSGAEWIDADNTLSPGFGTPLEFAFTVAPGATATLTVVDAGFAGDTYAVTDFGRLLGRTSAVALQDAGSAPDAGTDFDAALADASFSRGVFQLAAGSYRIGGRLEQSVAYAGTSLDATVGGLRLAVVSAVPEPSALLLLAAGLAVLAFLAIDRRS